MQALRGFKSHSLRPILGSAAPRGRPEGTPGGVPERTNGTVLKTVEPLAGSVGSNPTPSAKVAGQVPFLSMRATNPEISVGADRGSVPLLYHWHRLVGGDRGHQRYERSGRAR